jgi:hypothetical protein
MEPADRQPGNFFRRTLVWLRHSFAKSGGERGPDPDIGRNLKAQRMCPFCGLITSSYKSCCLECGKTLPA